MNKILVESVVSYLNVEANKKFRGETKTTMMRITRRINDGYNFDDFKYVIDVKVSEWKGGSMDKYLRPETLFGKNFESYLNQKESSNTVDQSEVKELEYMIDGYDDYLKLMMKMDYGDYMKTNHWKHFRSEAIKFFGAKCQLCNDTQTEIHIHHKTYDNRGRETFNDVIPLCKNCHELVHDIKKPQKK